MAMACLTGGKVDTAGITHLDELKLFKIVDKGGRIQLHRLSPIDTK